MANPLIKLELLRRFRSQTAAWGIPLMLFLPGLAVVIIYATSTGASSARFVDGPMGFEDGMVNRGFVPLGSNQGIAVSDLQGIGVGMFVVVAAAMLLALILMVPSMVGGSIAGERHNQTLQPLQLTAMTPTQILVGKLVATLSYLLLLLLCATPVLAIPFLLGGITASQAIGTFVLLIFITVEFAAISLAVSSFMARPAPAIMVSLLACAFLTVAPWVALGVGSLVSAQNDPNFSLELSSLRFVVAPSPVALGSWLPFDGEWAERVVGGRDRFASAVCYLAVVIGCVWFARSRLLAPVERDR